MTVDQPKKALWLRLSRKRCVLVLLLTLLACIAGGYGYWRHRYPYGWSHCCDKILYFSLIRYAEEHDGVFPRGGQTPEADLSKLLVGNVDADLNLLRGKTVPLKAAEETHKERGHLTPSTCGWHYVPGLKTSDDSRIALFWDKAGLGHNGERLNGGGHVVTFLDGSTKHVKAAEWDAFISEQNALLAARAAKKKQKE